MGEQPDLSYFVFAEQDGQLLVDSVIEEVDEQFEVEPVDATPIG